MNEINVTSIQRGCVYDGSGVRTTVFLKGCQLRCPWCCNPETQNEAVDYFIDNSKCLHYQSIISPYCSECRYKGGWKSVTVCPFGVCTPLSQLYTPELLLNILLEDNSLFMLSNGGVTFSGGEPLLHAHNLVPVLEKLKMHRINICFETSLVVPFIQLETVIAYVDSFIVDVKLQPEMMLYDDNYLKSIENMTTYIVNNNRSVVFRLVFVNSIAEEYDRISSCLKLLNIDTLDLISCHNLGQKKYEKLNLENRDFTVDIALYDNFAEKLLADGINVNKLKI